MGKYRKKPVVIEAVQVPMADQMAEHGLVLGLFYRARFVNFMVANDKGYDITTLEGVMHAAPGDWIIQGVKGEFYPCKPDVFEATYEEVK